MTPENISSQTAQFLDFLKKEKIDYIFAARLPQTEEDKQESDRGGEKIAVGLNASSNASLLQLQHSLLSSWSHAFGQSVERLNDKIQQKQAD